MSIGTHTNDHITHPKGENVLGILSGNPQEEPLHYGEVFAVWTYLTTVKGKIAGYQTLINHVGDHDLKMFIEDIIRNEMRPQEKEVEALLKDNGVALPPSPPERPTASLESIPVGARFNDPEIAMMLSQDIATGLVACSQAMGQAIREDVGAMFGQFHLAKAASGLKLLQITKEKGWLVPPPLHIGTPEPVHV